MKPFLVLIFLFGIIDFTLAKNQNIQKRFHFGGKVEFFDLFFAPMIWKPFWSFEFEYKCGGTWIHKSFALTSAYCLKYHSMINHVGTLTYDDNRWSVTLISNNHYIVEEKFIHENYSYSPKNGYDNDIGLVKIRYYTYNPLFGHFPQPYLNDWTNPNEIRNTPSAIFGFGRTETGDYAEFLKYMKTKLHFGDSYAQEYCNVPAVREGRALCLEPVESNARIDNGDYGSPVFFNVKDPANFPNTFRIIIGIVSFAMADQRKIVIVNTSYYQNFIENTIKNYS